MTIARGLSTRRSVTLIASFRITSTPSPKPAEISGDVENKRIVVVYEDNQNSPDISAPNASKMRRALARVSSYSVSGSEIAVTPQPA